MADQVVNGRILHPLAPGPRYKLNLLFDDRLGIVADISALLSQAGYSIVSMEVQRLERHADVYTEVEKVDPSLPGRPIMEMLGQIPSLVQIKFIEDLPHERREHRFRVVLENIRDGVLSVDVDGRVTTVNPVAAELLGRKPPDLIGRSLREIGLADTGLAECLKGRPFTNVKTDFPGQKGHSEVLATGRPIRDSAGRVAGAVQIWKDVKEIRQLAHSIARPERYTFHDFLGENPGVREAVTFAKRIARTDAMVSIRGASGTGKELFARAIHSESGRPGPFVAVNCAALPEALLESELFGYTGGSFTGARREGKAGLFETAQRGTVFLDEIAEMPAGPQAKILRVIQEKSVRRIGGDKEIPIDTRIITATNQNLERMVAENRFRQDLYYRINVLPIHLPPLKERPQDIPLLADHFLQQLADGLGKPPSVLSPAARARLLAHDWPGNVRELKNVIERAAILSEEREIPAEAVVFGLTGPRGSALFPTESGSGTVDFSLAQKMDRYERRLLMDVLERAPSIRGAAKELGISHTALMNKMKKYNLILAR
jgi:transcriptional regulator of aroF, aroG, tyrA and aromatic amino acid transport